MGIFGPETIYKRLNDRFGDVLRVCWPDLSIYGLFLAAGVLGDLATCSFTPLPLFWAQILPELHYLAVVFAAVRFGPSFGLAAAFVAGVLHPAVTVACGQSTSRLGPVAMFAAMALVAGWVGKRKGVSSMRAESNTPGLQEGNPGSSISELGRLMPELVDQFRTPMASMQGAAFVLEDPDLSQDRRQEFVGILRKECRHLQLLVELLDFTQSRLLAQEEVDAYRLIEEVIAQSMPNADSRIALRNLTSRDLPRLRCEPQLIKHALEILTADALRAVPQSGEVALSAHSTQGEMVLSIEVRAANSPLPLETALNRTLGKSDLGIVRHVTERHGGSVRLEPSAGGGAKICMILPTRRGQTYERREHTRR